MQKQIPHRVRRRIANKPIDRIAQQLGYITIYWAWLESAVDNFIAELADIGDGQEAEAITGNVDIRQKAQMVKALAFLRRGQSQEWYENVLATINTIDNDLRGRRNTFVHSAWHTPKGKLTRHKKIIKITKPQSFQEPTLQTMERVPVKISEAKKLCKDIVGAVRSVVFDTAFCFQSDFCALHHISYEQFLHQAEFLGRRKRKKPAPRLRR